MMQYGYYLEDTCFEHFKQNHKRKVCQSWYNGGSYNYKLTGALMFYSSVGILFFTYYLQGNDNNLRLNSKKITEKLKSRKLDHLYFQLKIQWDYGSYAPLSR